MCVDWRGTARAVAAGGARAPLPQGAQRGLDRDRGDLAQPLDAPEQLRPRWSLRLISTDRPTTILPDAPLIVFDTKSVPEAKAAAVLFVLCEHVKRRIEQTRREYLAGRSPKHAWAGRTFLAIDECWKLTERPSHGALVQRVLPQEPPLGGVADRDLPADQRLRHRVRQGAAGQREDAGHGAAKRLASSRSMREALGNTEERDDCDRRSCGLSPASTTIVYVRERQSWRGRCVQIDRRRAGVLDCDIEPARDRSCAVATPCA